MDTRVSLIQALKSLGFQGGAKHDTELNQWINHEKEILSEIMQRYEIEWEQKKESLTADVEAAESDIKALKQEKVNTEKDRDQVRKKHLKNKNEKSRCREK